MNVLRSPSQFAQGDDTFCNAFQIYARLKKLFIILYVVIMTLIQDLRRDKKKVRLKNIPLFGLF